MYRLILRVMSVTLMLICISALDHAVHPPHHAHAATDTACTLPPTDGASSHSAVDQVHPAHPCVPVAVQQPVTMDDPALSEAVTTQVSSGPAAAAVSAADAAHPPGRCVGDVLSATCVLRN
ncbi:hypothetical protein [Actinoplanes utahensis]|uniref:hypothetical protein n=1 Tax=Actinoplanes utahensis TaxID=1869 RepID=UPI00194F270A|nr:hypothetical protein [Actinoplanes utahensis]GIF34087.1 hypothetical protein Aut01nite_70730 [Actinoplanes utahensis]